LFSGSASSREAGTRDQGPGTREQGIEKPGDASGFGEPLHRPAFLIREKQERKDWRYELYAGAEARADPIRVIPGMNPRPTAAEEFFRIS
jgi:hypothetical protein